MEPMVLKQPAFDIECGEPLLNKHTNKSPLPNAYMAKKINKKYH